jgi:hypothetical protein
MYVETGRKLVTRELVNNKASILAGQHRKIPIFKHRTGFQLKIADRFLPLKTRAHARTHARTHTCNKNYLLFRKKYVKSAGFSIF